MNLYTFLAFINLILSFSDTRFLLILESRTLYISGLSKFFSLSKSFFLVLFLAVLSHSFLQLHTISIYTGENQNDFANRWFLSLDRKIDPKWIFAFSLFLPPSSFLSISISISLISNHSLSRFSLLNFTRDSPAVIFRSNDQLAIARERPLYIYLDAHLPIVMR